jgi:hypothetical protein
LRREAERKALADAEAAAQRATDAQVLEDAERLIGAWNERQARRMPMLFSPTIGAAIAGALPGLPHDEWGRPADARSPPRRRG